MKPLDTTLRQLATLGVVVLMIGSVLTFAPMGAFSQDNGGVTTPTPSNDGQANDPYDCSDFDTAAQARAVYADEYPGNASQLDEDGDGTPCEGQFSDQSGPVDVEDTSSPTATPTPTTAETSTPTATETATDTATAAATATTTEESTATATATSTEAETEDQAQDATGNQSAEDIVQNAVDTYDGIEDFNATRVQTSTTSNSTTSETTNTTQKLSVELPDKVRIETLTPEEEAGDITVSNGSAITFYDASNNTVRTLNTSDSTTGMNETGYFDSISRTLTGSNVTYLGTATVAGQDAYALSVEPNLTATNATNATLGGSENQTLYLEQESYFPVRQVSESSYTFDNETTTIRSVTTFRDVQVNVGLDDDLFEFEAPEDAERLGGLVPNVSTSTYDSVDAANENTNFSFCGPSDVPEGYALENATVRTIGGNSSVTLLYTNGSDDPLNDSLGIRITAAADESMMDEQTNTTYGENVTVNGQPATYTNVSERGILSYTTDERRYLISGPFSKDELVSIAESFECEAGTQQDNDTDTDTGTEGDASPSTNGTTYYQVDFVAREPIENLRGEEGTYSNGELVRFAHGSSDDPITRRSEGEFTTNETLADRIESQNITVKNGTATTTFTVSEGESVTLSLVSYTKPEAKWSPETEHLQEFVDSETRTFESGTHTLTVDLPDENTDNDE